MYTAELKLPLSTPKAEKVAGLENILQALNLVTCRKVLIGSELVRGISGEELVCVCRGVQVGCVLVW